MWSGVILVIVVLFLPETFPPILLKWKAKHLRELTGDQRYRGSIEVRQETFLVRLRRSLYRPFLLTFREPIIILIALYLTVIYIVLFTFLEGFTYIYQDTYGNHPMSNHVSRTMLTLHLSSRRHISRTYRSLLPCYHYRSLWCYCPRTLDLQMG